jgi:methyltransferase (TIGR00027 family)
MRILVFILIELILYPVTMLGVILFMGVILFVNRPRGISGTTYEPLMNRLMWHEMGTRSDAASKQLSAQLPATAPFIWGLVMGPTRLAAGISGFLPGMLRANDAQSDAPLLNVMVVRARFFDRAIDQALPHVRQLVILGAGWDTRAYDLPAEWAGRVFEVDAPATQAVKVKALQEAGIDASHVTFVAVDFHKTSWLSALKAQGFDPELPTYLLWEGVTMYLNEAAINETLQTVASLADGSCIGFDYFGAELLNDTLVGKLIPFGMALTYGEKIISGIPMQPDPEEAVRQYLAERGLVLQEFEQVRNLYGFALAAPGG